MPELARAALARNRRSLTGWTIGFVAMVLLTTSFYPTIRNDSGLDDTFNKLPDSVKNLFGGLELSSSIGYLTGRLFSFVLPAMLLVFAIGRGAAAIAGEEEQHWLNLVLAHPVSRQSVIAQRTLALVCEVIALAFATFVALALLDSPTELNVAISNVASMVVSLAMLGIALGALALAVGAATGRRGTAIAVTTSVGLTSYLIDSLGKGVDVLRPLRPFTIWRWYLDNEPLRHGFDTAGLAVLLAVALVCIAGGAFAFDRRDIRH